MENKSILCLLVIKPELKIHTHFKTIFFVSLPKKILYTGDAESLDVPFITVTNIFVIGHFYQGPL